MTTVLIINILVINNKIYIHVALYVLLPRIVDYNLFAIEETLKCYFYLLSKYNRIKLR